MASLDRDLGICISQFWMSKIRSDVAVYLIFTGTSPVSLLASSLESGTVMSSSAHKDRLRDSVLSMRLVPDPPGQKSMVSLMSKLTL